MKTRRQFLMKAPIGLFAAAAVGRIGEAAAATPPPGAPPTFGTAPPVGPEVSATTFAEASKLAQVSMTASEREMAAKSWRTSMASMLERRTGSVDVAEARSDWAPDPANPLPKFSPPRRVPHGVTLIGRLFDEGTIARVGIALEKVSGVVGERPPGF